VTDHGWRRGVTRPGQGLVEFALALSLLLLVVLGTIELALLAHTHQVAVSAAQEGARVASAEGRTLTEGVRQAEALLAVGLGGRAELLTVTTRCAATVDDSCVAEAVAVRVSGDYPLRVFGRAPIAVPIDVEVLMHVERLSNGP
jgi:Flp pilus assembly protein TadG